MGQKLRDSVVVVTGAASGIGLATAFAFARHGAALVLAGRQQEALEAVAADCRETGTQALAVPTDVVEEDAVANLARRAVEQFGRIDVWVNNAAVTAFGGIEELPVNDFRRVMDTNLFGYLYGVRAALPIMREQGSGTIINVSSGVAFVAQPYTAAYVASKHAIRALSGCLRMELMLDGARDIHVCTVYTASIDTPLFQRGANYTGRAVQPMPPIYEPEQVADAIIGLAKSPRREAYVGIPKKLVLLAEAAAPGVMERKAAQRVDQKHFRDRPAERSDGSLYEPVARQPELRGGWGGAPHRGPKITGVSLLAGLALGGAALLAYRNRDQLRRLARG